MIKYNELIIGRYYEVIYDTNNIYTVIALSQSRVQIITKNKKESFGSGGISGTDSIIEVSEGYARNPHPPKEDTNKSALFLLNKEL